jgi:hypothetical protein
VIFEARSGQCAFCTGSALWSPQIAGPSCGAVSAEHITTPFFARPKSQSTNAKEVSDPPPPPAQQFYERVVRLLSSPFRRSDSKTRSYVTSLTASQVIALSRTSSGHKLPEYSCLPPISVCRCNLSEDIRTVRSTSRSNLAADLTFNLSTPASKGSHLETAKVAQIT